MTGGPAPGIPKGLHTIQGIRQLPSQLGRPLRAPAVAIGNFDGVHKGHQALIHEAAIQAKAVGGEAVALTFHPHPPHFFAPTQAPPRLTTADRKADLLHTHGADIVLIEPFDAELAALSAETFVDRILVQALGAKHVVVGADFSFGKNRQGNSTLLAKLCRARNMGLTIVDQVTEDGLVCSSTKIREFVLEGRVEGAALLLGRPFELEGIVVKGFQRGRILGFPTANLAQTGEIVPKPGVYAGRAILLDGCTGPLRASISIGNNPTFAAKGDPELLIEAHLLDFSGDIYGKSMRLSFIARLRDQRRFPSLDELTTAIRNDIDRTRELVP